LNIAGEENDLNTPKIKVGLNQNLNRMKKLIYGGLFLTAVGVGLASCNKEQLKEQSSWNDKLDNVNSKNSSLPDKVKYRKETIYFEYFLDNKEQYNPSYDLSNKRYYNIVEGVADSISKNKTIKIHTFTSFEERNLFLQSQNMDFSNIDQFEKDIYNSDLISNCENGDCDEYLTYQDSLFNLYFGNKHSEKILTAIHDNANGGSPAWYMTVPTVPFMAPGWNNRASAINNLDIGSFVHLYDRTFFRKRLASFVGFHGWQIIPFVGGLSFMNNKLSSAIH
jgi:hypothetical protein